MLFYIQYEFFSLFNNTKLNIRHLEICQNYTQQISNQTKSHSILSILLEKLNSSMWRCAHSLAVRFSKTAMWQLPSSLLFWTSINTRLNSSLTFFRSLAFVNASILLNTVSFWAWSEKHPKSGFWAFISLKKKVFGVICVRSHSYDREHSLVSAVTGWDASKIFLIMHSTSESFI